MTRKTLYSKRIIAVAVAVMLLVGTLFTGVVSSSAASLTDGLTSVATKAQDGNKNVGYSTVTDITGGGIKYETTNNGALSPYAHSASVGAFPGDGVRLQFNNYVASEANAGNDNYQKLMVVFALHTGSNMSKYYRLYTGTGALLIDTENGKLALIVGGATNVGSYNIVHTIATDEALKYSNVTGKPFTVDFAPGANGSIDVAFTVGDDYVYGNIPADKWNMIASDKKPGNAPTNNTFFAVSTACASNSSAGAAAATGSFEYYGFKKGITITKPQLPLTTGITNIATSTTKVAETRAQYKPTLTDIAGGGVTISYPAGSEGAKANSTQPYVHNVSYGKTFGTKVTMQFDNFVVDPAAKADMAGYQEFEIVLGSSITKGDYYYRMVGGAAGLVINAKDGKLLFVKGTSNGAAPYQIIQTLATNDALKYANLTGKDFTVTIEPITTAQLKVTVTIEGTLNVEGIITAASWNKEPDILAGHDANPKLPEEETFIAIAGTTSNVANNTQPFSIDYYGFKTEAVNPPADASKDYVSHLDKIASTATNGYAHNSAKTFYSDILGGGVKYSPSSTASYHPYIHNENVGDITNGNFLLQFNNYKSTATKADAYGYRTFAIGLFRNSTSGDNYRKLFKDGCVGLNFDTVNGKLVLVEGNSTVGNSPHTDVYTIITNDALKYDNLTGKPFAVEWISGNPNITIKVTIDNGEDAEDTVVSGTLPLATYLSTTYPLNTSTGYFAVTGVDNESNSNSWSIEYYGFKKLGDNPSVPGLTENLTGIATVEKNVLTRPDLITQKDLMGGGVSLAWTKFAGYAPYMLSENMGGFPGEGLRLQFADYEIDPTTQSTVDGYGQIAIVLSSTAQTNIDGTKPKMSKPILMIDTNNGTLSLVHMTDDSCGANSNPVVDQTIITNDAIKYNNFKNKPFSVSIQKDGNDYKVTLDINGTVLTGKMDYAKFHNSSFSYAPNALSTYVGVGGFTNGADNKFSMEFYGYESLVIPVPVIDVSQLTETFSASNNYYSPHSARVLEDIAGGGVSISFPSSYAGYVPYAYSGNLGSFPGEDGFKLQFSNYVNASQKNDANADFFGQIVIILSSTQSNDRVKVKENVPFLQIDTVNGKLLLRYCKDISFGTVSGFATAQEILTSDLLKAENFERKAFSLTFKNSTTSEGDVDIIIEVGGDGNLNKGETVTGVLDMEIFNAIQWHAGSATFISVGGFDNNGSVINPWSVEFYGYQNFSVKRKDVIITANDIAAVNAAIAALPATATEAAAEAILLAKAQYDSLDATAQGQVAGADKLEKLIAELNTLRNASKIKPVSTYLAREADASLGFPEFGNQHARTLFSKATDNGFAMEWRGGGAVSGHETIMSQSIYGAYKLDGLRLFLDNYTFADKASDFWVQFTSGDYDDFWNVSAEHTDKTIAIRLGLQKGRLELYGAGNKSTWVAGDTALLHRDNLKGKDFIIEWKKQANGSYNCYITIGEQVVAFNLATADIANMPNFDENEVRVIIGNGDNKAVFSMEATGIYSQINAASQSVIDKINTLPATVKNAADVTAVNAVVAAYNALSVAQKEQVYNVDALTAARAAVRKYEGVDEKGRDKNGYYIPNALTDVYGDASKDQVYVRGQESPLGGIRYEWGGEGYGRKNCFKEHYVIDSISVRYDNWQYANDGALIVGFENSTQECKVFDRKQFDTRNGIWLLIGRDNTIYSTYANRDVTGVFPLFEANELLSGTNLMRKEFFVSWNVIYNEDGSMNLQVVFTVDGKDFKYTYDKKYMDALDLMDIEDIQVVTHCVAGNSTKGESIRTSLLTSALIDITGIKYEEFSSLQKAAIQEVIDAIDALPEKGSYDIEESVYDIWKMYYSLSFTEMRLAVTNHSKLIKLYDEIFDMHLADGTMYVVEEEEDEDYEDEDDYEWDDSEDDYDAEYDDEDNAESEEESKPTKKPIKVKRPKQNTNQFPWIIVIIGGIVLLAAAAIVIILVSRKNKEGK